MQTKLIDERWYKEDPKTLCEAKAFVQKLLRQLEEAEKMVNKPDYELAKRVGEMKVSPKSEKEREELVAEIKGKPLIEKGLRPKGLYVLPYKDGKPHHREARLLTHNLKNRAQLEQQCTRGTEPKTEVKYRTRFSKDLLDKESNAAWPFKPSKLEIIEKGEKHAK